MEDDYDRFIFDMKDFQKTDVQDSSDRFQFPQDHIYTKTEDLNLPDSYFNLNDQSFHHNFNGWRSMWHFAVWPYISWSTLRILRVTLSSPQESLTIRYWHEDASHLKRTKIPLQTITVGNPFEQKSKVTVIEEDGELDEDYNENRMDTYEAVVKEHGLLSLFTDGLQWRWTRQIVADVVAMQVAQMPRIFQATTMFLAGIFLIHPIEAKAVEEVLSGDPINRYLSSKPSANVLSRSICSYESWINALAQAAFKCILIPAVQIAITNKTLRYLMSHLLYSACELLICLPARNVLVRKLVCSKKPFTLKTAMFGWQYRLLALNANLAIVHAGQELRELLDHDDKV